jgi:hypothetical protein
MASRVVFSSTELVSTCVTSSCIWASLTGKHEQYSRVYQRVVRKNPAFWRVPLQSEDKQQTGRGNSKRNLAYYRLLPDILFNSKHGGNTDLSNYTLLQLRSLHSLRAITDCCHILYISLPQIHPVIRCYHQYHHNSQLQSSGEPSECTRELSEKSFKQITNLDLPTNQLMICTITKYSFFHRFEKVLKILKWIPTITYVLNVIYVQRESQGSTVGIATEGSEYDSQ